MNRDDIYFLIEMAIGLLLIPDVGSYTKIGITGAKGQDDWLVASTADY